MSQDAINASAQNAVVGINNIGKVFNDVSSSLIAIATAVGSISINSSPVTQISTSPSALTQTSSYVGSGTLARISVIVPGTGSGFVYDKGATSAVLADSLIAIPATIGVYEIHMKFSNGLVVAPGYGQTVIVSYTPD